MKKKELIVIALLILLALVYLVLRTNGRIGYDLPDWKSLRGEDISTITYGSGDTLITLEKSGDNWILEGGEKADPEKIGRIMDALGDLDILDKLSEQEDYRRYKLDEEQGTRLELGLNNETRELIFGKKAPGGGSYVSFPNEKGVYSVNRELSSLFPSDPMKLRDRTVLSFNPEGLHSISLTKEGQTIALKKEEDQWFRNGEKLDDSDPLVQMIPGLSILKCNSFMDEDGTGDSLLEIRLIGEKNQTLSIYNATKDGYMAASSETNENFLLSKYIVDGWLKVFED